MQVYQPKNKIRIVTAASLFDGHDAAINIMRRIMQSLGAEVIHLGHDRSVQEVVSTAIQEDANAIAMTSYQGGHVEYLKYMFDLLQENKSSQIKIFAGGGGVILPSEIKELEDYGITRIYSPDDGRALGLEGMIADVLQHCDFPTGDHLNGQVGQLKDTNPGAIARLISAAENFPEAVETKAMLKSIEEKAVHSKSPVLGITGTGGSGKSSLIDEIVRRFLADFPEKRIGIISVDPSKRKTGGALLGDRIRMNAIHNDRVYMRSMATRQSNLAVSKHIHNAVAILKAADFDLIILETSGIGQSDTQITDYCDVSMYVMTPEFGAASQLEKIDMLDFADIVAINKFDKRGSADALRAVKKQYQRNHKLFDRSPDEMPVYGSIASQFNDPGTNRFYHALIDIIAHKTGAKLHSDVKPGEDESEKIYIIPPARIRYLSEITENNRKYNQWALNQAEVAGKLQSIRQTINELAQQEESSDSEQLVHVLETMHKRISMGLDPVNLDALLNWDKTKQQYKDPLFTYKVRNKELQIQTHTQSLSHLEIPKVAVPGFTSWNEILKWVLTENFPGFFPFAAGIYPFKREGEDPTRMFAGEGGPERTNKRFHYVSQGLPAVRLSTAFDSVTLYGEDPAHRPDIFGKIDNKSALTSGDKSLSSVLVCTLSCK